MFFGYRLKIAAFDRRDSARLFQDQVAGAAYEEAR